ncbi:MAG: ribosome biogenesis GTPase Der [Nitrospiria bacterium]
MKKRPVIAIIGRPNVGKSTLFNKLVGRRKAIVQDEPGITRDRNEALCRYRDREYVLVDTGGMLGGADAVFSAAVQQQSEKAVDDADVILFILDALDGVTPVDAAVQTLLRKSEKPVYHVINKTEGKGRKRFEEFYALGADLYPVSSEHNIGLSDLLDALYPHFVPMEAEAYSPTDCPTVVLLGRPNAGKSTLLNAILKEERILTSDVAGTTRDTIDARVTHAGKPYLFIDTAGIRRRGKVVWGVEQYSVSRAHSAIKRANVVLLLIDGGEGVTEQDTKLAGMALDAGRGLIVLVNKSDIVKEKEGGQKEIEAQLLRRFPFAGDLQTMYISALSGKGVPRLFQKIDKVYEGCYTRVTTGDLNRFFERILQINPPSMYKGKPVHLYYITQTGVAPPNFVIFTNAPKGVQENYLRYIQNQLRGTFGFQGAPIRIKIKERQRR